MELRLFHNYMVNINQPFPKEGNEVLQSVWRLEAPKMALKYDNLLYIIFSLSASYLLRQEPHNQELIAARQHYTCLALRQQRKELAQLNNENSDAVCFASLLIVENAFATLGERSIDPYFPPMEWLHMGRGAGTVFGMALETARSEKQAKILPLINASPRVDDDEVLESRENRRPYLSLLSEDITQMSHEVWDEETEDVYGKTLSFLGAIKRAVEEGHAVFAIGRWLMAFPLIIPDLFIDFVAELRPRALIILAHYFSFAAQIDSVWFLGDTTKGEIVGIHKTLPPEYHLYLRDPLRRAGLL